MADDPKNAQEVYEAVKRALEDANKSQEKILQSESKSLELLENKLETLKILNDGESSILIKLERKKAIEELTLQIQKEKLRILEERIANQERLTNAEIAHLKSLQAVQKISKEIPSLFDVFFGGEQGGKKLIDQIGNIGKSLESNVTKKMQDSIASIDFKEIFEDAAGVFKKDLAFTGSIFSATINAIGEVLASAIGKAFAAAAFLALTKYTIEATKLASSLADLEIEFMRATGANREFARSITVAFRDTRRFGVGAKEASAAAQDLFGTFTDFTFQNIKTREDLIVTTALLDRLGFNAKDAATSLQIMTKAMGRGPGGASQEMLNLTKFAEELGVPVSKIGRDFATSAGRLAKLGDTGVDAFKRLAIASKVTGLELQKILNITDKFDTFEGAATQAGKLNAALGGNFVNAMDLMLATDPVDRFSQIRDSILNAGLSFDTMSYFQRKFFADSMGLSDVNDLALILKGNMDMVSGATQQSSRQIEEAAIRAREFATLQEKLNILFSQMIPILTPIIDLLIDMTTYLSENAETIKPLIGGFLLLASAAGLVASILTSNFVTGAGSLAGIALGFALLTDSIDTNSQSISLFGSLVMEITPILKNMYNVLVGVVRMFFSVPFLISGIIKQFNTLFGTNFSILKGIGALFKAALTPVVIMLRIFNVILSIMAVQMNVMTGNFEKAKQIVEDLGYVFFRQPFASSFLEGLIKIGNAFEFIGSMVIAMLSPVQSVIGAFTQVGQTFANLPFINFGDGAANINVQRVAAGRGGGGGATVVAADGGGTMTVDREVVLKLDNDVLERFILRVTADNIKKIRFIQS